MPSRTDHRRNILLGLALTAASVLPAVLNPTPPGPPASPPTPTATAFATSHPRIFFGSLHSHTKYSDGSGTPADAFARARDQGKMDFLAVTEHNHDAAEAGISNGDPRKDGILIATQPSLYNGTDPNSLLSAARTFTTDGSFIAIAGQEFSTISSGNHTNVFEVADVIDVAKGDYKSLYDTWLPQHPDSLGEAPLAQFNHPDVHEDLTTNKPTQRENDYGYDDFNKSFNELRKHSEKNVSLIEIVSGPALSDGTNLPITSNNRHEKDYWFYLNEGFRLAPTANQDNHFFTWGTITRARTAVLADHLTKADILHALKARHVYATEDQNLQVRFTINNQQMGDVIRTPQPLDLSINVEIVDPDEPNATYTLELYRDEVGGDVIQDPIDQKELEGDGTVNFDGQRYESGTIFFFIKVSQRGTGGQEEFAWTAPIWIEFGQPPPPPTPTPTPSPGASPTPATTFVHSRNSQIYHFANCADVANIKPENRVESTVPPEDKTLHKNCPRVKH